MWIHFDISLFELIYTVIESIIKIVSVSQTIGNMLAINGMTQILFGTFLISMLYSMVNIKVFLYLSLKGIENRQLIVIPVYLIYNNLIVFHKLVYDLCLGNLFNSI